MSMTGTAGERMARMIGASIEPVEPEIDERYTAAALGAILEAVRVSKHGNTRAECTTARMIEAIQCRRIGWVSIDIARKLRVSPSALAIWQSRVPAFRELMDDAFHAYVVDMADGMIRATSKDVDMLSALVKHALKPGKDKDKDGKPLPANHDQAQGYLSSYLKARDMHYEVIEWTATRLAPDRYGVGEQAAPLVSIHINLPTKRHVTQSTSLAHQYAQQNGEGEGVEDGGRGAAGAAGRAGDGGHSLSALKNPTREIGETNG
jgi:hypothetical protein